MSRGPGVAQVRIMEALDTYHRLGGDLGWKWRGAGRSFYQKRRLMPDEYDYDRQAVAAYESGRRVEVWMLRRDTGLSAAEMSRALHSLRRRGFVHLYECGLDGLGTPEARMNAKYVQLSTKGDGWLNAKKVESTKLALSQPI